MLIDPIHTFYQRNRSQFVIGSIIVMIVIIGSGLTWYQAKSSHQKMRDNIISQASMLAALIDAEHIQKLTGTLQDTTDKEYKNYKQKLIAARKVNLKYRYIYLLGQRGRIHPFFLVDTSIEGEPDYTPAGLEYTEASALLRELFQSPRTELSKPYSDRWGNWVSAFIPIYHPQTHEFVAIFAIDVDVKNWNRQILTDCALPVLSTLLALFICILTYLIFKKRSLDAQNAILEQTEVALRETDDLKKRVYESSKIAIGVMEYETSKFIDFNIAAVKLTGYDSIEELIGKTPADISTDLQNDGSPSDIKSKTKIDLAIEKGIVVFEWRLQRKNGEIWDAEIHLMSFTTNGKKLLQFTLQDISDRKRIEEELLQEREFTQAILDSMPGLLYLYDEQGRIVRWNKQHEQITGYSNDEIAKMSMLDWFKKSPTDVEKISQAIQKLYIDGHADCEANLFTQKW